MLLLKVWFVTGCEEEKKETWWLQSVTCDNGGISRVLYKNRKKDIECPSLKHIDYLFLAQSLGIIL